MEGTPMPADLAIVSPPSGAERTPATEARHLHPAALPQWRALLGFHWQERLERVTEFSLAYHDAEEVAADTSSDRKAQLAARRRASGILHRAVAERRALAEIEAALARLSAGRFGWCEQCGSAVATTRLTEMPQTRYCTACDR
jgi:RNA polymerase-binding transcription factor DksA